MPIYCTDKTKTMECNVRNSEALASAETLTVSEVDLQRIKQQGCGTSRRDRNIMRLPDLKAFTYPLPTNVPVEITSGSNNKYMGRQSVNAEGFVPPFVNQPQESEMEPQSASYMNEQEKLATRGSSAVPALAFAGTGEIAQLNDVTFGSPPVLYKQIASSIIGEPVQSISTANDGSGTIRDTETPLGPAGVVGMNEMQNARELQRKLYGSATLQNDSFLERCKRSAMGFLYDLLHFDQARAIYGGGDSRDISHLQVLSSMANRDGRGVYLIFILVSVMLCVLLLFILGRSLRGGATATSMVAPRIYTYCTAPPVGMPLAPLMSLPTAR